jgi:hypothetical protein
MRVVFSGPSLPPCRSDLVWRGPARHGDIARAVADGATHIAFIDGLYDDVASVWHKEILHVLENRVHLVGGGSLGAVRAAECAFFGMIGIGEVFRRYVSGELDDDAAVAQLHAPAELDFQALTEAMVNIDATVDALEASGRLDPAEGRKVRDAAQSIYFKNRTLEKVVEHVERESAPRRRLFELLQSGRVDMKRRDAEAVVTFLASMPASAPELPPWGMARTATWMRSLALLLVKAGGT